MHVVGPATDSSGTTSSSSASIRFDGSVAVTTGGIGEVVLRQVREQPAHAAERLGLVRRRDVRDAARVVCTVAPPSDSASISSWVTAFTTLGPVTNM